jgi:response regulator RpfG family c-di-GMP phosphodiesterase
MLRGEFDVGVASGGAEGLKLMLNNDPFAVVVADMRMPGMDGVEFLRKAEELAPETTRMMLTGNADLQTAVQAVNEGHIFRFLTKPCPKETMVKALEAGVRQYRLVIAERQLLEETVNGSITVLAEILSLVNPTAFGRAIRIRRFVKHIVSRLGLPDAWQFEVAAMLSQVGCVALPPETLEKVYAAQELSEEEAKSFASHPDIGGRLIVGIPRLDTVAHMIARQQEPYAWAPWQQEPSKQDPVVIGGQILKVALGFDRLLSQGTPPKRALAELGKQGDEYCGHIVAALQDIEVRPPKSQIKAMPVSRLDAQMTLDQDVYAKNGSLLVTKGQQLTIPVLVRLRRWAKGVGVVEPIRVIIPQGAEGKAPVAAAAT